MAIKGENAGFSATIIHENSLSYHENIHQDGTLDCTPASTLKLKREVSDLKRTIKINKEIIKKLLSDQDDKKLLNQLKSENFELKHSCENMRKEIAHLNDKCLILDQIKTFHEKAVEEIEKQSQEQIAYYIDQLDHKEYVMQLKEKKFNDIEKILNVYAKSDNGLRKQLTQLRYLCDEYSTQRGIRSVVEENETLKKKLKATQEEVDSLVNVVKDLNRSYEDPALEDITIDIEGNKNGPIKNNYKSMTNVPTVPTSNRSPSRDCNYLADYQQLYKDQLKYSIELERKNRELEVKNKKLADFIKSKTLKYKNDAKDSIARVEAVKKKLQEYDGLNQSVFETIDHQQKLMELREITEAGRPSILSDSSEIGSIIIGGVPSSKQIPAINEDDDIIAEPRVTPKRKRSRSKPFLRKQETNAYKPQIEKLSKDLEQLDRKFTLIPRVKSDPKAFKRVKNDLVNAQNRVSNCKKPKTPPSVISDVHFEPEDSSESPVAIDEFFGESFDSCF